MIKKGKAASSLFSASNEKTNGTDVKITSTVADFAEPVTFESPISGTDEKSDLRVQKH